MDREELLRDHVLNNQLDQALSDFRVQKDVDSEPSTQVLNKEDNEAHPDEEFDVSYKYKRNKKSKDCTEMQSDNHNQSSLMQNSVNKVETLEQMEKKIEEEQEFIRSLEERKKIIMHNDDAGYNEDEEQQDIKIPENKDNSISMKAISPAYQISEYSPNTQFVPNHQSNMTFNATQPIPSNLRKNRPSDVVNFDEKSDKDAGEKSVHDHSNPLSEDYISNRKLSNTAEEINFYQNEGFSENNEKIDDEIKEIEDKLMMTKSKIQKLEQQNAYAEKQKKSPIKSSHGLDESQGNCSKSTPNEQEEIKKPEVKSKRQKKKSKPRRGENYEKKQELKKLMKIYEHKQRMKGTKGKAAIVIQKWIRGYLQRKEYKFIKLNLKMMRKLRRLLSVGYKKIKTKFIKNVVQSMKTTYGIIKKDRSKVMDKFLNACATIIQK